MPKKMIYIQQLHSEIINFGIVFSSVQSVLCRIRYNTDNGSEFSNPRAIEYSDEKFTGLRTNVFYCDAGSPYQKGAIEVNHELIRRVLSKGTSFNNLTQEDINLMMNHINSYKRKKLNNRSPYETFSFYHGEEVLHKLGCSPVAASDIMLKPRLLKK